MNFLYLVSKMINLYLKYDLISDENYKKKYNGGRDFSRDLSDKLRKMKKLYVEKFPRNAERNLKIINDWLSSDNETKENLAGKYSMPRRNLYTIIAKFKELKGELVNE